MNEQYRDQILEASLREVLAGPAPPDLSVRILQSLASSDGGQSSGNGHGSVPLAQPVATPIPVSPPSPALQVQLAPTVARRRKRQPSWAGLAFTSAVVVIGVGIGIWALRPTLSTPGSPQLASQPDASSHLDSKTDTASLEPAPRPAEAAPVPSASSPDNAVADTDPKPRSHDPALPDDDGFHMDNVPFGHDASPKRGEVPVERVATRAEPLADTEIIASINGLVRQVWQDYDAQPSEPATDAEWCRRVYLRLVGRIPTVDELDRFVAGNDSRRQDLVDQLVATDEFAEHWSAIFTNMLIGRTGGLVDGELADRDGLRGYLEQSLASGKPYNEMVFELVSAQGSNSPTSEDYNAAVNYLLAVHDSQATLATARTCQVFLGRQIGCVQCHNHPTKDGWSQHDFWAMNAFFRQTRVERDRKTGEVRLVNSDFPGEGSGDLAEAEIYYEDLSGYKRAAYPKFPNGPEVTKSGDVDVVDRRRELARWIASSDDLSRALVNRVWAQFFGYGFTKPVDDMGPHNPPSHPELLEQLAAQFVAHDYDIRGLVRWISSSEPFGLSSRTRADQLADVPESGGSPLFSRYYTRPLEPEEVYKSLLVAARSPGQSSALQAPQDWLGQFSRNMGTDEGNEVTAFHGDINKSLVMMNGPLMRQATSLNEGSLLRRVIQSQMSGAEKIEHLFLASVARKPTKRELEVSLEMVQSRDNPASALQDIWWALLNSSEFILDH